MIMHVVLLVVVVLAVPVTVTAQSQANNTNNSNTSTNCPLDFSLLQPYLVGEGEGEVDCSFSRQALHLLLAAHLLNTSLFLPPASSDADCWARLSSALSFPNALPSSCGFSSLALSLPCMNLSSRADFEAAIPAPALSSLSSSCLARSLAPVPSCTACTTSLNSLKASYLPGPDPSNLTPCSAYPFIYAAAFNSLGPTHPSTAFCLFLLNTTSPSHSHSPSYLLPALLSSLLSALLLLFLAFCYLSRRRTRRRRQLQLASSTLTPRRGSLQSISASTTLSKFTLDQIRQATSNFSRDNIIGRGGYGNVYSGVLPDGSHVAVKRFKNCSAAGEDTFVHEVEVIASVRHVNLVALRGYCICTTPLEGHQRIIVCDLITNGSLHDHLFSPPPLSPSEDQLEETPRRLPWPVRQKIALGTARGLAYLHYGARPAIIHRDIKASNILLDDDFEAKVADFGLAKFAPEGMTHVSTRVAGTMGYVAPEYALYGQLTEKSDVYSFGVVLLELLSGKRALISLGEGQSFVITDWAWSLVRRGCAFSVIEEGMEECGPAEVMERHVLVAVLCTHPQLHARPTMDQVLKILETDAALPPIPDRPIPIVANRDDIERSVSLSSGGSGQLFSPTGFQTFSHGHDIQVVDSSESLSDKSSKL
ncbi:Protein kinase superfamily protein [Rhynchospora pubera]|uniref:non-specific serine/threonine protein kinase n=1 Tax=Rhynchospora pubera TaxID=906938 RepID=A0AAV8G434_9POAL|nr:Protein kinase superfamily protein [Rhynchospora pubera]